MHRRHLLAVSGALVAGAVAGCVGDDSSTTRAAPGVEPEIEDEQLAALIQQTNGFAFDWYRELLEEDEGNVFASPASVTIAMAMTYAGARGDTRDQLREVLRYPIDDDELHEAFNALQRELDGRGEDVDPEPGGRYDEDDDPVPFQLSLVNGAWSHADYPFDDAYLEVLDDHYGGELREADFAADPDGVREEINGWVADHTEDRIDELLPEGSIDGFVRLVLVNAVYFFANWKYPFSEELTEPAQFTALDGTDHEVQLMSENRSWPYAEVDGVQAVELPYVGDDVAMLVVLPPEGEFESYERSFDGETLAEVVDALEPRDGTVRLPRFEYESEYELSEAFERLGAPDAFDPDAADFSGMVEGDEADLYVDGVYHDAFVAVDEEGTEAVAATGVVVREVSAPPDPFELVADRPFLFAIRDRPTGTILFLGRVVDPEGWA